MSDYIAFPALGWKFSISPYLVHNLQLFGLTINIRWYGVMIAVGFLLAMIYALRSAKRFGINSDRMIDVVLVSTLIAFVGARLYYVVFSDERAKYFANPISILEVWNGGLAIYGGILFAFIAGIVMCRWRKVNTLAMFDLASLGFLIGQGIGRWGNFFNQEAFGANTTLPWGMTGSIIQTGANGVEYDPLLPVHPTFLYESLWCLLGFLVLHLVSKKAYTFKGKIFSMYLIWYGAGRFVIESLRTDSLYLGTMRVSQLVAILAILGGVAMLWILRVRSRQTPADLFAEEAPDDAEGLTPENDALPETLPDTVVGGDEYDEPEVDYPGDAVPDSNADDDATQNDEEG